MNLIMINSGYMNALVGAGIVVAIAVLLGLGLVFASDKFAVKVDPREEKLVNEILPGYNCGACGFPGCGGYAAALIDGSEKEVTKCKPGGAPVVEKIKEIME